MFSFEGADAYLYFKYAAPGFQRHAHLGFGLASGSLAEPIRSLALLSQDFKAWPRWTQALQSYQWLPNPRDASLLSFMLFNLRYQLQPLLHRLDRMLMIHSIEGRVPFLEQSLIDFSLNLPLQHKVSGSRTKRLLKEVAAEYLPRKVVHRKKMGFTVPWLRYSGTFPKILENGFVADWVRLNREQLKVWLEDDPIQLYKLIALEVWGQIFVHKVPWQEIQVAA